MKTYNKFAMLFALAIGSIGVFTACENNEVIEENANNNNSTLVDHIQHKVGIPVKGEYVDENGGVWHYEGSFNLDLESKYFFWDITIVAPDGNRYRFGGYVSFVQGEGTVSGTLTDEKGNEVKMTAEMEQFLIGISKERLEKQ